MTAKTSILTEVADYLKQYVVFSDENQPIVLAAWTIATHVWPLFDALAYLAITAKTKRAGKSRLGVEVLQYLCAMGKVQVAPTPAGIFRDITNLHPTLIFDEAESMSSEAKSVMRALMNAGYKRGQKITRAVGKTETQDFDVYCPKVFILIGSPNSTLSDRSIVIELQRSLEGPPRRYLYSEVLTEATALRAKINGIVKEENSTIYECYVNEHADYLVSDRDEEIVRPILAIAKTLGTAAEYETVRKAIVDIATMKTGPKLKEDKEQEKTMEQLEYANRLRQDLLEILATKKKQYAVGIKNTELVDELHGITLAPWRKYLGVGLDVNTLADLMRLAGIAEGKDVITVSFRRGAQVMRGYKWEQIAALRKDGK